MLLIHMDSKFSIYNGAYIIFFFLILTPCFNLFSYIHVFTSLVFYVQTKKILHLFLPFPKC